MKFRGRRMSRFAIIWQEIFAAAVAIRRLCRRFGMWRRADSMDLTESWRAWRLGAINIFGSEICFAQRRKERKVGFGQGRIQWN